MKWIPTLAVLLISIAGTGCLFKKKQAPVAAMPPIPKPDPVVLPAPPPPKIEEAAKPKTGQTPAVSTSLPDGVPKPPPAKKNTRRPRRATAQSKPGATGSDKLPTPDPGTVANDGSTQPPAVNPLRLGEFLSDAQRADIQKQFEQTMQRARTSLERLSAKRLDAAALESVERVRGFLTQADQARARDPQTALQLAQRADVLATDLLNR